MAPAQEDGEMKAGDHDHVMEFDCFSMGSVLLGTFKMGRIFSLQLQSEPRRYISEPGSTAQIPGLIWPRLWPRLQQPSGSRRRSEQLRSHFCVNLLRPQVFYSTSVSHPRHDEIRQPPVAFSAQQTKFSLELEATEMSLTQLVANLLGFLQFQN